MVEAPHRAADTGDCCMFPAARLHLVNPIFGAAALLLSSCTAAQTHGATTADFLTEIEERLVAAVVDSVASSSPTTGTTCLVVDNRDDAPTAPSPRLLATLESSDVVTDSACPETYQTMIQPLDSLGRPSERTPPPGHVDPVYIRVFRIQGAPPDTLSMTVNVSQGTRGRTHACTAFSGQGGVWAICRLVGRWIS